LESILIRGFSFGQAVIFLHRQLYFCTGSYIFAQAVIFLHRQLYFCTGSYIFGQAVIINVLDWQFYQQRQ
jgi:hypothetical protein